MQELRRVLSLKKLMLIVLVAVCNIIFFLYANKPVTDDNILEKETIQHETYLNEYSQNIDTIISNAEKLKKYSIFTKAGTFSYANILRTSEDFERVKNVEVFYILLLSVFFYNGTYDIYSVCFFCTER